MTLKKKQSPSETHQPLKKCTRLPSLRTVLHQKKKKRLLKDRPQTNGACAKHCPTQKSNPIMQEGLARGNLTIPNKTKEPAFFAKVPHNVEGMHEQPSDLLLLCPPAAP